MAKKNNKKRVKEEKQPKEKIRKSGIFNLPEETKKWIWGVVVLIIAAIVALSFFNLAGVAGKAVMDFLTFLVGKSVYILPLILALGGLVFFNTKYDRFFGSVIIAMFILAIGAAGTFENFNPGVLAGGWAGYLFTWPFLKLFGYLVSKIIFAGIVLI